MAVLGTGWYPPFFNYSFTIKFKVMEITGRVTADAAVRKAGNNEVVNFTIAVNDRYKRHI